jgi:DNA primase
MENTQGVEMQVAILPEGQDPDEILISDASQWGIIIADSVPSLDFIFQKSIAGIDLNTARGKSDAVEKLMPIINRIQNVVKQAFYFNKLAKIVGQDPKKLELLLNQNSRVRISKTTMVKSDAAITSNPLEEYCLAIILQYPETKEKCEELLSEYFDNSENRELYHAILNTADASQIKLSLDSALWEHYEQLSKRNIIAHRIDVKLAEIILRMKEEYTKRLARNRADTLAIGEGKQLREIFMKKDHLNEQKRQRSEHSPKR